ncbi:hypothetical protein FZEAL_7293 [Fusarium zealandicum]|uniref:Uncharacterized protein n=1 Tax=Fusarium zealandicum TaxID=1053134 RepID=A0A8H4XJ06_9HYPO|nr:hypothetical protein FZEAL_7293 [Fusarium zealandicum]
MSQAFTEALDRAARSLCGPAPNGQPNLRFGHVTLPLTYRADFDRHGTHYVSLETSSPFRTMFVVPGFEAQQIRERKAEGKNTIVWAYPQLLTVLKRGRARPGTGPDAWKDNILPRNVFVVFSVDLSFPVDCALALLGVVQWALDVSMRSSAAIRILALSTDKDLTVFNRLINQRQRHTLLCVDLSNLGQPHEEYSFHGLEDESFEEEIVSTMAISQPHSRHVLLLFRDDVDVDVISETTNTAFDEQLLDSDYILPSRQRLQGMFSLTDEDHQNGIGGRSILCAQNEKPLMFFRGFTHMHMVFGMPSFKLVFDRVKAQVVQAEVETSNLERHVQMSWSRQPDVQEVHIYCPSTGLQEFLKDGPRHHRAIDHHHAGAFIAAVFSLHTWGLEPVSVLRCFELNEQLLVGMLFRLSRQQIVDNCNVLRPGRFLTGPSGSLFQDLLPAVRYDYQIAYFLAIESSHPLVAQVKMQVATLLTMGLVSSIEIRGCTTESLPWLAKNCWGYGRELAATGTIWLALGLWKRLARDHNDFQGCSRFSGNHMLSTLDGVVSTPMISVRNYETVVADIFKVLSHHEIFVSTKVVHEESAFSPARSQELQYHLLRAYAHQLTMSQCHNLVRTINTIISTGTDVAGIGHINLPHLFDIEAMAASEAACLRYDELPETTVSFGICGGFANQNTALNLNRVSASFWTGIPAALVLAWKREIGLRAPLDIQLDCTVDVPVIKK